MKVRPVLSLGEKEKQSEAAVWTSRYSAVSPENIPEESRAGERRSRDALTRRDESRPGGEHGSRVWVLARKNLTQ